MDVRYNTDPETGLPHIHAHGVTEDEAESVLRRPGEDRVARDGCRSATGQTFAGRYLRIIYVRDAGAGGIFVVTGYEIHGKTLKAYRKRRRR